MPCYRGRFGLSRPQCVKTALQKSPSPPARVLGTMNDRGRGPAAGLKHNPAFAAEESAKQQQYRGGSATAVSPFGPCSSSVLGSRSRRRPPAAPFIRDVVRAGGRGRHPARALLLWGRGEGVSGRENASPGQRWEGSDGSTRSVSISAPLGERASHRCVVATRERGELL